MHLLCNFHWEQRQIKHLLVISYFWLFARQRTHQAFVFYDNCQSVIPSLIWRLRGLECFSSNLESDLSSAVAKDHRTRETTVKQQKKRLKRRVSDETDNDENRFLGKMGYLVSNSWLYLWDSDFCLNIWWSYNMIVAVLENLVLCC